MIAKRCNRVYEDHLRTMEPELHRHLCDNEVVPELHLTRWLRCMMSREFQLETTLKIWDFIFAGIEPAMVEQMEQELTQEELNYDTLLKSPKEDPYINLECFSIAMISLLKADLLESDFSMCLGLLMSYKEPENPLVVLEQALKVRKTLINEQKYEKIKVPVKDEPMCLDSLNDDDEEEAPYSAKAPNPNLRMPQSTQPKSLHFNPLAPSKSSSGSSAAAAPYSFSSLNSRTTTTTNTGGQA